MCLAIPSQIVSIDGSSAECDMAGNRITADISLVPDASVGDFVVIHAGFAIQKYDEEEARKTLETIREYVSGVGE
jgi:hydrogenase expression/formation protein HypC